MKFKLTVPEGTTLHQHLKGLEPRARNFELLSLAARGMALKEADEAKSVLITKKDSAVEKVQVDGVPLFDLDELSSLGG